MYYQSLEYYTANYKLTLQNVNTHIIKFDLSGLEINIKLVDPLPMIS